MKVLALGGSGGMGVHACRIVAGLDAVTELVVTDLDERRARRFAETLGPCAAGRALDVDDAGALAAAMRGADMVMNTVGPFFRFGVPILAAAIEAGCDYIDICDDWEPTVRMLEMGETAAKAGVTALVGMGASPGISNLLAVAAAGELDTVREIITGWNIEVAGPESGMNDAPGAAIVHGIEQLTGTIRVTREGRVVDEPALRRVRLDYPGLGRRNGWTFGHPEALTLPAAFPTVTSSVNVVVGSRSFIAGLAALRFAVDRGLLSKRRAARIGDRVERLFPSDPVRALGPGTLPPLFALAVGTHDGEPASVGCALAHAPGLTMGETTGIPLGLALGLLTETKPGVHTPETLIDPMEFFAALAPHCPESPSATEMVVTTRSWDVDPRQAIEEAFTRARHVLSADSATIAPQ
ncbi:saccharopine dehydrogenase family protein [Nocardia barduliensis]|uniref:saccharopine dehydrogenase family protein n=1 Tax=Nocardia barduliensis TaxID=2736643 RepID=UPI001571FCB1|nr:saccharopine dehydrogenase NADP-binding domain-containing protein [Nocardia barduliensis]